VQLVRPNYHGDTVRIAGRVTGVAVPRREALVRFAGISQLGETVVEGEAVVLLPSKVSESSAT